MTDPVFEHSPVRAACDAMGCRFEICITDPGQAVGVGFLRAVCEEAIEVIQDWHRRLSGFDRGSVVSQLNQDAADRPVRVSDDVMALLLACQRVHTESGGAFDVTVGPLMRRWGFRGEIPRDKPEPAWGMRHVVLAPKTGLVSFDRPGIELDLGGVAKGLALDDAAEILREAGVRGAILHGGTSTAIAIGPAPDHDPFTVALGTGDDAPVVRLRDSAMSVSAPHGRMVEQDGKKLGHVIDPRTGEPTDSARLAATLGPSAMLCDAWSTAILVMGECPGSLSGPMTCMLCPPDGEWIFAGPGQDRIRFR